MARPEENSAAGALALTAAGGFARYKLRITQNIRNKNVRMPAEYFRSQLRLCDWVVEIVWSIFRDLHVTLEENGKTKNTLATAGQSCRTLRQWGNLVHEVSFDRGRLSPR